MTLASALVLLAAAAPSAELWVAPGADLAALVATAASGTTLRLAPPQFI